MDGGLFCQSIEKLSGLIGPDNFKLLTMVEVFKTNVHKEVEAARLLNELDQYFPCFRSNFDLEDCDKILRVEGLDIMPGKIMEVLHANGFHCSVLE